MRRERRLVDERLMNVLGLISDNPEITYEQIAEKMDTSRKTTERDIRALKNMGYIERVGNTRASYWTVRK
ncbi:MAG: winged helix-turn-helix transcriptional regulator [Spirochaetales bacterium]|nr:winged helix-turn-helix transcriptional regulator [Spirochaetales bacterium]MBQ2258626.1 winged helix-turn-helix transcriptional regulator [Spirochaetales bacterium]